MTINDLINLVWEFCFISSIKKNTLIFIDNLYLFIMNKIQKKDHFYLIDGSGYIFRAYYALPPLTRKSDGLPTGAVSGFCSMLFKLLEDSKSDKNLQRL